MRLSTFWTTLVKSSNDGLNIHYEDIFIFIERTELNRTDTTATEDRSRETSSRKFLPCFILFHGLNIKILLEIFIQSN